MHTHDLINSPHLECCASISMQVLDESSQVFYNFIKSLHSDSTKESCIIVTILPFFSSCLISLSDNCY